MDRIKRMNFGSKTILYGKNSRFELLKELNKRNLKHAFIGIDSFLTETDLVKEIIKTLNENGIETTLFSDIVPNPSAKDIMKSSDVFKASKADCLVAIGGGSTMDTIKSISAISCNEGTLLDYNTRNPQRKKLKNKLYFTVCMPTTCGTGSELSNITVIVNDEGHKVNVIDPLIGCDLALIDPAFSYNCPKQVIASCGFDAMMHSFEAIMGNQEMFFENECYRGIKAVMDNLELACNKKGHYFIDKLVEASYIGGFSITNETCLYGTPIHSLGIPASEKYHLAHGHSLSAVAPYVLEEIIKDGSAYSVAKVARACGIEEADDQKCAMLFVIKMQQVINNCNIQFPEVEFTEDDIKALAAQAMTSSSTSKFILLPFTQERCERVYRRALNRELITLDEN